MGQQAEREINRHKDTKTRLENQYKERSGLILTNEGIDKALVNVILGLIGIIIGLLLAPEPALSKVAAAIIGLGVGLFAAWLILKVIIGSSLDGLKKEQDAYNKDEKEEDDRHAAAMKEIGDK